MRHLTLFVLLFITIPTFGNTQQIVHRNCNIHLLPINPDVPPFFYNWETIKDSFQEKGFNPIEIQSDHEAPVGALVAKIRYGWQMYIRDLKRIEVPGKTLEREARCSVVIAIKTLSEEGFDSIQSKSLSSVALDQGVIRRGIGSVDSPGFQCPDLLALERIPQCTLEYLE